MNPPDLPNAMVIVQELESNNLRAQFANNCTSSQRKNYESNLFRYQNSNKNAMQGNHSNYNSNQRNTNNLRSNQPGSQNRNNYNQNKNHNWNQGRQFDPQYYSHNQWSSNKAQQNKPEPMEVDESLQIQNRPKYNQGYNSYGNNNYYQNKWNQNKRQETQTTPENSPQNNTEPTGTVNQPASKTMRLNNIEEDHFLGQNPE